MNVRVFLCCTVMCKKRHCKGLYTVEGVLPKYLKGFIVSEVHSESEQAGGHNP